MSSSCNSSYLHDKEEGVKKLWKFSMTSFMSVHITWALAAEPEDAIEFDVVVATDGVEPRRVSTDWAIEDFRDLDFNSKLSLKNNFSSLDYRIWHSFC